MRGVALESWQTGGEITADDLKAALEGDTKDIVELLAKPKPGEQLGGRSLQIKRELLLAILQMRGIASLSKSTSQLVKHAETTEGHLRKATWISKVMMVLTAAMLVASIAMLFATCNTYRLAEKQGRMATKQQLNEKLLPSGTRFIH